MEEVAKKAGFASREAFIADLRTNPKYYAKTPEELMQAAARETEADRRQDADLVHHAAAPALRHPRDPGRDRRGHDDRLLQPGLARKRHRRHLLCQHVEARPAAAVGNPAR